MDIRIPLDHEIDRKFNNEIKSDNKNKTQTAKEFNTKEEETRITIKAKKPTKLSKSVSLKHTPGTKPMVPNVKGFSEEQIRQLVESQKTLNNSTNVTDGIGKPETVSIPNKRELGTDSTIKSPIDNLKNIFESTGVKSKRLVISASVSDNTDNDRNAGNQNIGIGSTDKTPTMAHDGDDDDNDNDVDDDDEDVDLKLDLESTKRFFEQITKDREKEVKKKTAHVSRSKSAVNPCDNKHKSSLDKKQSMENELKTIFEKKFSRLDGEKNNSTDIGKDETPATAAAAADNENLDNEDENTEIEEDAITLPVSETKAFFESKTISTPNPFAIPSPKIKNTSLRKSTSLLEKSTFPKVTGHFYKRDRNSKEAKDNENDVTGEYGENDVTSDEQVTVETLVNKYKSLDPETRTKMVSGIKSSRVEQQKVQGVSEGKKLPGKSLAAFNKTVPTGSESSSLGNNTWQAKLKSYSQKSDK